MNNKIALSALIGLLVGVGGMMLFGAQPELANETGMHDNMQGMVSGIEGKQGSEFDKAFLEEMIVHHEGAVVMATAALTKGERPEIKKMARAIIDAQTTEITQMKNWQKDWFAAE